MYSTTLSGMQSKLDSMLEKAHGKNQENLERITYDIDNKVDFVVPSDNSDLLKFRSNGTIRMAFNDQEFEMHPYALSQLASRYSIPTKYAKDLATTEWGRTLLRETFMKHKENIEEKRFLVRTVDNKARAVLSDSFRRMDSNLIYKSFLDASREAGAVLYDALYTETKTYLITVIPKVYEIPTPNNGVVYSLFGSEIRNSDYGAGRLESRGFQMNLICDNGMTSKRFLNEIHRGARLPEGINFSLETHTYDTKTMASSVRDIITQSLSTDALRKTVHLMQRASSIEVDIEKEVKKLSSVNKLQKEELEILNANLQNNREEDGLFGKPTKWKFAQAINSVSKEVSLERKKELDDLAGEFINYKIN